MKNEMEKHEDIKNGALKILIGALIGGLAGALTMWLLAPQSGSDTRAEIQNKTIELRDRTTENIKQAVANVRSGTGKVTNDVMDKAVELKQIGKDKVVEQLDRMSAALDNGKATVKAA